MSNATTIARPYAKAIFNLALERQELAAWSVVLHELAQIMLDPDAQRFINSPASTTEQHTQLLTTSTKNKPEVDAKQVENMVSLLAENKRLLVLPDIYIQYEALRAEQEKTLTANVSSFSALTSEQEKALIQSLSQRLQRQVTLNVNIDPTLLGGAVISAGDLVIDGSVRGKLNKLSSQLAT